MNAFFRYNSVVVSGKSLLMFAVLLCVCGQFCIGAALLPSSHDIAAKEKESLAVFEKFMRESMKLRLEYEYAGRFGSNSAKDKLLSLAQNASINLQRVCDDQEIIQRRIEDHDGIDWESRYGKSGLWRKILADIRRSEQLKCRCDYTVAMAFDGAEREWIVKDIIQRCEQGKVFEGVDAELMRIKAELLIANGALEKQWLLEEAELLTKRSGISDAAAIERGILILKCRKLFGRSEIDKLFAKFKESKALDDFDLSMRLAMVGLSVGRTNILKAVDKRWPIAEVLAGEVVLQAIQGDNGKQLDKKSKVEISLAATAMMRLQVTGQDAEGCRALLKRLCSIDKFRCAGLLQAAGESHVEAEPLKAVEYYIAAAKEQRLSGGSIGRVTANDLALSAAETAYRLYCENGDFSKAATEVLRFYCDFAKDEANEQIRYVYAGLLEENGQSEQAEKLLTQIAENGGKWAKNAKLDLLISRVVKKEVDEKKTAKLLIELEGLISDSDRDNINERQVRSRAIEVYCGLLLERNSRDSAQRAFNVLSGANKERTARHILLKGESLRQLERLDEAVDVVIEASKTGIAGWAGLGVEVLSELLDDSLETYLSTMDDPGSFVSKCNILSEKCLVNAEDGWRWQGQLVRAEFALIAWDRGVWQTGKSAASEAKKLLGMVKEAGHDGDIGWVRCSGRLAMAEGKWDEAVRIWGQICQARRGAGQGSERIWQWWRAKYYELECFSKLAGVEHNEVVHAVEVLENSFGTLPEPWSGKFVSLMDHGVKSK